VKAFSHINFLGAEKKLSGEVDATPSHGHIMPNCLGEGCILFFFLKKKTCGENLMFSPLLMFRKAYDWVL
jgi:hypothetical protein